MRENNDERKTVHRIGEKVKTKIIKKEKKQ